MTPWRARPRSCARALAAAGGTVGIAYRTATALVYVEDAGAGFGAPAPLAVGTKPAVALLPGGQVAVAFLEVVGGVMQVALWTDAPNP